MGEFGSPFQTVLFFFLSDGFKKCGMKLGFFLKSKVFGKNYQKVLLEKVEGLANTYKSGSLGWR